MAEYTQAKQSMRVETVLDDDVLLLEGFSGEEALSTPFLLRLDLLSEDPAIDGEALLRTEIGVRLTLPAGETRWIHGLVRRFTQRRQDRDLTSYRAEVVPWLWFLSLARDCRVFQGKDVLEIVEEVFTGQGYSDFEIRCTGSYREREYCVQYRETNLDFVSRLLEEEGIFYFFEHGEGSHVLVLADDVTSIKPCEGQPEARILAEPGPDEDGVLELEREHAAYSGQVTLADYDYLQPSHRLVASVDGGQPEEVYEFPGNFRDLDDGDRNARLALEREEALRHIVRGEGTCRGFHTGGRFRLLDHFRPDANGAYTLVELRHRARNGSYRAGAGGGELEYRNEFLAIPHGVPFRPRRRVEKPDMRGSQTAVVVGPAGEEIWTDRYGRVKIQFHWDRNGRRDEGSSCWVRVATPWGSKGFGSVAVPRVGDEVVVDFLEGDPDRPIVVGSVYNAERMPPYELPANQTQAGMKSHSVKGDGTRFSEIRFEDKPGEERLVIHAERDHHVEVENNEYHTVEGTALMDFGGVKIKAGNLGVGGGAGGPKRQTDYSGRGDAEYNGYIADYGRVYKARAGHYEGRYDSAFAGYGTYQAGYGNYNAAYGQYVGIYGVALGFYGAYVGGYGAYAGLYGLKEEHKLNEISSTKTKIEENTTKIERIMTSLRNADIEIVQ